MQPHNPGSFSNSFVALTMILMMGIIATLATIVYLQGQLPHSPVVIKTQVLEGKTHYPKIPVKITDGTYRIRMKNLCTSFGVLQGTQEATGSSFGVDLSEYGMPERRYLVTAAHCVIMNNKPVDQIDAEVHIGKIKAWIRCKCLVIDKDRDLAVLEAASDLPFAFKIAEDAQIGDSVFIAGCPAGTNSSATLGFLTGKDPEINRGPGVRCQLWQVSASFFFGNSGGPVFDTDSEKVIAVLVAGIEQGPSQLVPGVAIVVPCFELRALLDSKFKLDEGSEAFVTPRPEPLAPPKELAPIAPAPKAEIVPIPPVQKIPEPVQK